MNHDTEKEWLSIIQYARNFGVSDMTVRRRIKTGKLKAVLRDGKYYIPIHLSSASSSSNTHYSGATGSLYTSFENKKYPLR